MLAAFARAFESGALPRRAAEAGLNFTKLCAFLTHNMRVCLRARVCVCVPVLLCVSARACMPIHTSRHLSNDMPVHMENMCVWVCVRACVYVNTHF